MAARSRTLQRLTLGICDVTDTTSMSEAVSNKLEEEDYSEQQAFPTSHQGALPSDDENVLTRSDHGDYLLHQLHLLATKSPPGFTFTDAELKVEGGVIKAHKMVLAAHSDYFKEMFLKMFTNGASTNIICPMDILEIPLDILKLLVEFLYTGMLRWRGREMLKSLRSAACKLKMSYLCELMDSCMDKEEGANQSSSPCVKISEHGHQFLSFLGESHSIDHYADAVLTCKGKIFIVHRAILASLSEFFKKVFAPKSAHTLTHLLNYTIEVSGLNSAEPVTKMINYMYTGKLTWNGLDMLKELQFAAGTFSVTSLVGNFGNLVAQFKDVVSKGESRIEVNIVSSKVVTELSELTAIAFDSSHGAAGKTEADANPHTQTVKVRDVFVVPAEKRKMQPYVRLKRLDFSGFSNPNKETTESVGVTPTKRPRASPRKTCVPVPDEDFTQSRTLAYLGLMPKVSVEITPGATSGVTPTVSPRGTAGVTLGLTPEVTPVKRRPRKQQLHTLDDIQPTTETRPPQSKKQNGANKKKNKYMKGKGGASLKQPCMASDIWSECQMEDIRPKCSQFNSPPMCTRKKGDIVAGSSHFQKMAKELRRAEINSRAGRQPTSDSNPRKKKKVPTATLR